MKLGLKRCLNAAAALILVPAGLFICAATVVEFAVPKEKLLEVVVAKMRERLGRQVKMSGVSIGLWRGLRMEGVSISEAPDFDAGTFLEAERFTVHPRILPLLLGKASISQAQLFDPKVRIIKERDGRYNFSDIANGASAKKEASPAGHRPTMAEFLTEGWRDPLGKLKQAGELMAEAAGKAASSAAGLKVEVELARVRRGQIVFIDRGDGCNIVISDVNAWGRGLGPRGKTEAKVDFKLRGSCRERPLEAEAALEWRADMAGYHPVNSAGSVILTRIRHANFKTERIRAEWDLKGLSSDLRQVQGVARIEGSPGRLIKPASIARQGKWLGLLFYPVDVLAKFRGLGLPDMQAIQYSELRGEYSFLNGSINIAPLYVRGPELSINAEGVLNLNREAVGLKANLAMGDSSVSVLIKGPMAHPAVTPDVSFKGVKESLKTIEQRVSGKDPLLEQPFDVHMADAEDQGPKKKSFGRNAPERVGRQTIKDAEKLIDQAFP